jgi:hypothetical protein
MGSVPVEWGVEAEGERHAERGEKDKLRQTHGELWRRRSELSHLGLCTLLLPSVIGCGRPWV